MDVLRKTKQLVKRTGLFSIYAYVCSHWKCFKGKNFPVWVAKGRYKKGFKKELNLNTPKIFAEKINWLKLYYYPKDELAILAGDKWGLHIFLEGKGLSCLAPPLIGVYDSVDEINWKELPERFVIKKSNASGYNIIITNKEKVSEKDVKKRMKKWMKKPFGYLSGQHHYEKMQPKIIIEKYIEGVEKEWRVYCFNGEPKMVQMVHWFDGGQCENKAGRKSGGLVFMDLEGEVIGVFKFTDAETKELYPKGEKTKLPSEFQLMLEISETVSEGFPFVRVDFSYSDGKLILGELTFTPANGFNRYNEEMQEMLGELLVLPSRR